MPIHSSKAAGAAAVFNVNISQNAAQILAVPEFHPIQPRVLQETAWPTKSEGKDKELEKNSAETVRRSSKEGRGEKRRNCL